MGSLGTVRRGCGNGHGQAEGGGVLEEYLTVQRLYPNQEMSCMGRCGRVRPFWRGGKTLGRSDNNPPPSHRFAGVLKAVRCGSLLVDLPNFLNGIVNTGSLHCST